MNSGSIQVWDASRCEKVRDMHPHEGRVGSLAWAPQSSLLASGEFFRIINLYRLALSLQLLGSRDRQILIQDTRIRGGHSVPALSTQNLQSPHRNINPLFSTTPSNRSSLERLHFVGTPPSRSVLQSRVYNSPQRVMEDDENSSIFLSEREVRISHADWDRHSVRRHTLSPYANPLSYPPRPPLLREPPDNAADLGESVGVSEDWDRYGASVLDSNDSDDESIDASGQSGVASANSIEEPMAPEDSGYLRRMTMESWLVDEEGFNMYPSKICFNVCR